VVVLLVMGVDEMVATVVAMVAVIESCGYASEQKRPAAAKKDTSSFGEC